ncbi:phosphocholine cytidylyltransferase family protein [uncultured Gimesia sp.]|uniref:phosphocholine cytidylyltransferase family protein n=1 Tax=uncultured Gimesia sp. TaxID=1678688 RepID=UPI002639E1AF|nr:phosphocholine cytidylyltransferase family protein [uncultured Gimesia sp.]
MKAIIMAAGVGSRLKQLIGDKPKCLIETDGITLISRSVSLLKSRGISDISVITGYKSEYIHQELQSRVKYFHNPYFRVTNSIASLWLAKDVLSDDVILMNADLYYEEAVLDTAIAQTDHAVMLSDSTRIDDADFRFSVQGNRILKTGNQLSNQETDCEYVGIVRIDKSFIATFKKRLEEMIVRGDFRNWWEGVLYSFIDDGIDIFHSDVEGAFWTEVDHLGDYNRLVEWNSSPALGAIPVELVRERHLDVVPNVSGLNEAL